MFNGSSLCCEEEVYEVYESFRYVANAYDNEKTIVFIAGLCPIKMKGN